MSSYFNIVCLDCKCGMFNLQEATPIDEELQRIVDNLPAYLALNEVAKKGVDFHVRAGGEDIDLKWLEEHKDHRLAVAFKYESWEELEKRLVSGRSWWEYRCLQVEHE